MNGLPQRPAHGREDWLDAPPAIPPEAARRNVLSAIASARRAPGLRPWALAAGLALLAIVALVVAGERTSPAARKTAAEAADSGNPPISRLVLVQLSSGTELWISIPTLRRSASS